MGYYDKFLTRFFERHRNDKKKKAMLIGVAFNEQIVNINELPMESHDYKLDLVVTSDWTYVSEIEKK